MKPSTRAQYKKLLSQLKRWSITRHNQPDLTRLTADQITEYELYLIQDRRLAISSVNQHRLAINKFYAGHGLPIRLQTKSARTKSKLIETVAEAEAAAIIAAATDFYRPVLETIYHDLAPPGQAVPRFPTPRGHISLQAVNNHLAKIVADLGLTKRCRAKMLHQSGIVHALKKGQPWRDVAAKAGLKASTIQRYLP